MARWHFGLLTVVCLSLLATRASASDFGHYACGGWPGYSPYGVSYSWWYQRERIPYFALHPPVYYSQPVARPYGYSPFAYPPYVLTPEVTSVPAEPVMIPNPYVPQEPAKQEPAKQAKPEASAQAPLTILNPFVAGAQIRVATLNMAERPFTIANPFVVQHTGAGSPSAVIPAALTK